MSKPFLKNILAAVNGSQSSMQAVMYGIIMAKQYNLNLKIVYVVDTATVKFWHLLIFLLMKKRTIIWNHCVKMVKHT